MKTPTTPAAVCRPMPLSAPALESALTGGTKPMDFVNTSAQTTKRTKRVVPRSRQPATTGSMRSTRRTTTQKWRAVSALKAPLSSTRPTQSASVPAMCAWGPMETHKSLETLGRVAAVSVCVTRTL